MVLIFLMAEYQFVFISYFLTTKQLFNHNHQNYSPFHNICEQWGAREWLTTPNLNRNSTGGFCHMQNVQLRRAVLVGTDHHWSISMCTICGYRWIPVCTSPTPPPAGSQMCHGSKTPTGGERRLRTRAPGGPCSQRPPSSPTETKLGNTRYTQKAFSGLPAWTVSETVVNGNGKWLSWNAVMWNSWRIRA